MDHFTRLTDPVAADDAGFELVVAGWLAEQLGSHAVEFVVPGHVPKPDLMVTLQPQSQQTSDNQGTAAVERFALECKRQRDQSEATTHREKLEDELGDRVKALVETVRYPAAVYLSATAPPSQALRTWMLEAVKECLQLLNASPQRLAIASDGSVAETREWNGNPAALVVVRRRLPGASGLEVRPGDILPNSGSVRMSMPLTPPLPSPIIRSRVLHLGRPKGPRTDVLVPRYIFACALGTDDVVNSGKRLLDRASRQLPASGGSAVAIWSRDASDDAWSRLRDGVRRNMSNNVHSRFAGVYLFGADTQRVFEVGQGLLGALRVEWLAHPAPRRHAPWPISGDASGDAD